MMSPKIFRQTLLRYVRLVARPHEPSVCRLSVTLLHLSDLTHRIVLFGNIFAPSNGLETPTVCINFLTKKNRWVRGDRAVRAS